MAIGESSTPLSNLLLEELATRYGLPGIRPLTKWGTWQQSHPELACGLKRGFSFFRHEPGQRGPIARASELLVAASPHDAIADTHWYRADFDQYLVEEAQRLGVEYMDEVDLREFFEIDHGVEISGTRNGREMKIATRFVVDATGPRGFLHRALKLGERPLPEFPATQALYSYFQGVHRISDLKQVTLDGEPPYPVDDAAVHHLLDGGWVWVLHFSNGITSAGVAATDAFAEALQLEEGEPAWKRLLERVPALWDQFAGAKAAQPFRHIPRLGFRSAAMRGQNWALLPSAAGFVDPLLSTGFPLTLLGVSRLAEILERDWGLGTFSAQLESYAAQTDAELLVTSRLIGALYANLGNFPVFVALSLLYFAAASYSEVVRRLGRPQLASSFLLRDHPQFGPQCARVLDRARLIRNAGESEELIEEIFRVIAPIDVAGLSDRARRNWYPVEAEDLLGAAHKVGATRDEIALMLERCGIRPATLQA